MEILTWILPLDEIVLTNIFIAPFHEDIWFQFLDWSKFVPKQRIHDIRVSHDSSRPKPTRCHYYLLMIHVRKCTYHNLCIVRRSAEDVRRVSGRRNGRTGVVSARPVPVAAELCGQRGRARGRHAAARQAPAARQVAAAALARLRRLPQRRGVTSRLRRKSRRLLGHRETFRDQLLRLSGDHHQNKRRLTTLTCD